MKLSEEQAKVLFELSQVMDFTKLCEVFKYVLEIEQIHELDRLLDDVNHEYEDYSW